MYSKAPKSCAVKGLASARDSLLGNARISLVKSLLSCPANLQWKVWLAGARLELSAGSLAKARRLLLLSLCRCACISNACPYSYFCSGPSLHLIMSYRLDQATDSNPPHLFSLKMMNCPPILLDAVCYVKHSRQCLRSPVSTFSSNALELRYFCLALNRHNSSLPYLFSI